MSGGGFRRGGLVAALGLVACVVCTPAPASPLPPWCEYVNAYLKKLQHCCYSKKFKKSEKNEIWREVMKFLDEEEPEDFVVAKNEMPYADESAHGRSMGSQKRTGE